MTAALLVRRALHWSELNDRVRSQLILTFKPDEEPVYVGYNNPLPYAFTKFPDIVGYMLEDDELFCSYLAARTMKGKLLAQGILENSEVARQRVRKSELYLQALIDAGNFTAVWLSFTTGDQRMDNYMPRIDYNFFWNEVPAEVRAKLLKNSAFLTAGAHLNFNVYDEASAIGALAKSNEDLFTHGSGWDTLMGNDAAMNMVLRQSHALREKAKSPEIVDQMIALGMDLSVAMLARHAYGFNMRFVRDIKLFEKLYANELWESISELICCGYQARDIHEALVMEIFNNEYLFGLYLTIPRQIRTLLNVVNKRQPDGLRKRFSGNRSLQKLALSLRDGGEICDILTGVVEQWDTLTEPVMQRLLQSSSCGKSFR